MSESLLIEIGVEELPPKALRRLGTVFADQIRAGLGDAGLQYADCLEYATPRRLAIVVHELAGEQADRKEQRRGPALAAAFDDAGQPTKAALGFARSCGVEVSELGRLKTEQGEWLALEREVKGEPVAALIGPIIDRALGALPIPKRMRWGAGDVEFVRPAHWVVVLYGTQVLPCEVLGISSGRLSRGHRFHHPDQLELRHADDYAQLLEQQGHVIASFAARRSRIVELIEANQTTIGGIAEIDDDLLDEVTALVEWPAVIAGSFDEEFLKLPAECLIASMQDHQKYFPVRDTQGKLINRFVTISNIDSREPNLVRDGNERVIRPRLADADFFYRSDRATSLADNRTGLADMLFEKRLGSLADKTARVVALAANLADACGASEDEAARAATLSRCDLLSAMVGEFPELQGTMGGYYAAADGESAAVSTALQEFYQPRFAGDDIASTATGRCIAIADRLDSLVGIFGIGSAPTGDKDPYALRRAALGVLRTLVEANIELDLRVALESAYAGYGKIKLGDDTVRQVLAFMRERLRGYYLERGVPNDACAAVLATDPHSPADVAARIDAVIAFSALDASAALSAANKRIANILRKLDEAVDTGWQSSLLQEPAEQALGAEIIALRPELESAFTQAKYQRYLSCLAGLREPVDKFFDEVMVMSEDPQLRANRLALLNELHQHFTRVADIAQLSDK